MRWHAGASLPTLSAPIGGAGLLRSGDGGSVVWWVSGSPSAICLSLEVIHEPWPAQRRRTSLSEHTNSCQRPAPSTSIPLPRVVLLTRAGAGGPAIGGAP